MQELPQERLLIADLSLAASEAAFEWTRQYMKVCCCLSFYLSLFSFFSHLLFISTSPFPSLSSYLTTNTQDRVAFGQPLIKQQLLRHRLAHIKTDLVVGRTFVDRCLELHKEHRLDTATASMAKVTFGGFGGAFSLHFKFRNQLT
jgi:long-chain-acyl-CoA dehydrogenase